MRNDNINWRNIMYLINLLLINRISCRADNKKSGKLVCLVADDTDMPKTGEHIELIVRIHSHVKNISILGFKGLFLARTDGKTHTILDFSLHGEDAKHRDSLTGDEAAFAQGLQGIAPAIMPGYHAKAGRTAVGTVQLVIVGKGNHLRLFVFWILVEPVCYA